MTKAKVSRAVSAYARMWPREIFDHIAEGGERKNRPLVKSIDFLRQPGVYVPYYVGQAPFPRSHAPVGRLQ
jgi:hypothetical protein